MDFVSFSWLLRMSECREVGVGFLRFRTGAGRRMDGQRDTPMVYALYPHTHYRYRDGGWPRRHLRRGLP